MFEPKRILCPIDFSATSAKALAYAAALAAAFDSTLDVLHVVPRADEHVAPPEVGPPVVVPAAASRDAVIEAMRRSVSSAAADRLDSHLVVAEGRVHEAIVGQAADRQASLLVIGTHGRTGFNRLLLGSVTEKVIRTAACPVLTVPPAAREPRATPPLFQRILCAVDQSEAARAALRVALALAEPAAAHLTVLHVLEYMDPAEPCEHVDADVRTSRRHIIEHARGWLSAALQEERGTGGQVEQVVVPHAHRAYCEVLQRAAGGASDLIVVGAQGRGSAGLMLYGSNTHHIVRGAPCPVLSVRE